MAIRAELSQGLQSEHALFRSDRFESGLSQEVSRIRERVLTDLRPLTQPAPYTLGEIEIITPEDEHERALLVDAVTQAGPIVGRAVWNHEAKILKEISRTAGSHSALERIYSGPDKTRESEAGFKWADYMLRRLGNARAVRNRLNIVRNHVSNEVIQKLEGKHSQETINVLSIASGSSRAVLSGVAEFEPEIQDRVVVRLSDISTRALRDGAELASTLGYQGTLETRQANFQNFDEYMHTNGASGSGGWDLIEIVGLLDYPDDEEVSKILKNSYQNLKEDGSMIISNVAPNDEKDFLGVIGWPEMVYRTGDHLQSLADDAGFTDVNLISEPTGYCNLAVARK